jgi:hypothetical protein
MTYIIGLVVGLVVGLAAGALVEWLYLRRRMRQIVSSGMELMAAAAKQLQASQLEADTQRRRADQQFKVIEDAVYERDGIWKIYREHSIGSSNAQSMLMTELEAMQKFIVGMAQRYNFKPREISDDLRRVVQGYAAAHGDEGVARERAVEHKNQVIAGIQANLDRANR